MSPAATSHIVSCCDGLNEMAPIATRDCVTTAKIAIAIETARTGVKRPSLSAVFSRRLVQAEVLVTIIPHLPNSVREPSAFIGSGRPGPVLEEIVSGMQAEVPASINPSEARPCYHIAYGAQAH